MPPASELETHFLATDPNVPNPLFSENLDVQDQILELAGQFLKRENTSADREMQRPFHALRLGLFLVCPGRLMGGWFVALLVVPWWSGSVSSEFWSVQGGLGVIVGSFVCVLSW